MSKILSIIVPVYNESAYIYRCLENVINVDLSPWDKEVIVVDDGSSDNTMDILKKFQSEKYPIKIFSNLENGGKGAALSVGIQRARGDILIVQDADLEYDPEDIVEILKIYEDPLVNVVYGSRITGAKVYHNYSASAMFYFGGVTLTKICNIFLKTSLTDQPTGYKSWRSTLSKGLLEYCKSKGFEYEVEMTSYFAKRNVIRETPIHYYPRSVEHGKKIGLLDFIKSVMMVIRRR